MKPRLVKVNDLMQQGYSYRLTEPMGRCSHPDFRPELTPKEMLELGVFGQWKRGQVRLGQSRQTAPGSSVSQASWS